MAGSQNRINVIAAYAATQNLVFSGHLADFTVELRDNLEVRRHCLLQLQENHELLEACRKLYDSPELESTEIDTAGLAGLLASLLSGIEQSTVDEIIILLGAEIVHREMWEDVLRRDPLT